MADPTAQAELIRTLGRVVRGLSALFWGLPLALLLSVRTTVNEWLQPAGITPSLLAMALLFYGLWQLGHFQKQERIWTASLERAQLLALLLLGLSPFIYWFNKAPNETLFSQMVGLLWLALIGFIYALNQVLQRLAAMLPDETVRGETAFFSGINRVLLLVLATLFLSGFLLIRSRSPIVTYLPHFAQIERGYQWLVLSLILLPLALTMTLIWKIKEVIFTSVFGPRA